MSFLFGAKKNKRAPNWTPLVDVIFLLLIFFMVTSSLSHPSAQPLAATAHGSGQEPIPLLLVRRDGSFVLKGEEMSESQLRLALQPSLIGSRRDRDGGRGHYDRSHGAGDRLATASWHCTVVFRRKTVMPCCLNRPRKSKTAD